MTALVANMGIAASKFAAAFITGSASMLAEAVHSVADSTNQALLLVGGRRAARPASAAHPFGYARERYIYAFIVSIVLFTLGGCYAVYEGVTKLRDPHELNSPVVAIVVLVIAIALEGWALRTALKAANADRGTRSWWQFIRRAKAPELPVIILEDTGALVGLLLALLGVGLTLITGDSIFDALGTLAIGVLLVAIAVILAAETKSLLIGEAASAEDLGAIRLALLSEPDIDRVIYLHTMHLGPEDLLVAAKITVGGTDTARDVAAAIDRAEAAVRAATPAARLIFLEPDIYQPHHPTG
ncbi:cation diffusion facilitator family transporter [Longispora sp. NPDC051575]|uniref:cation diffusion facilitator family transporter n=1 Tax=Longispora sp. NPDC051575 TaxID=3154943 RepID=UPI0034242317